MSKAKKRLSPAQEYVLHMMRNGWELGTSTVPDGGGARIQQGGLGRGGKTETVSAATVNALCCAGLIRRHYGFPAARYTLCEKGESCDGGETP